jgi:hypothetical protein
MHSGEKDANNDDEADFHSIPEAYVEDVDLAILEEHTSELSVVSSESLPPNQEVGFSQITTLSGDAFTCFFSEINIFQIQAQFDRKDEAIVAQRVPSGNSREKPSAFLYLCKKGCELRLWS